MTKTQQQFEEKVIQDYGKIVRRYVEDGKVPLDKVFFLAHVEEIKNDLVYTQKEIDEYVLSDKAVRKALKYDGNIIILIFEQWLNYRHNESFNFFCYENTIEIINNILEVL